MYCPGSFPHLTLAGKEYQGQGRGSSQPQVQAGKGCIVCGELKNYNKTY